MLYSHFTTITHFVSIINIWQHVARRSHMFIGSIWMHWNVKGVLYCPLPGPVKYLNYKATDSNNRTLIITTITDRCWLPDLTTQDYWCIFFGRHCRPLVDLADVGKLYAFSLKWILTKHKLLSVHLFPRYIGYLSVNIAHIVEAGLK